MSQTKTCPQCGKEFEVILEGAKYCSYDCELDASSTYVEMKFTTAAEMLAEVGTYKDVQDSLTNLNADGNPGLGEDGEEL